MLQPPASPPVIHQSPPVPKKPQNKRAKNEPKNDALRDKLSGVETELKTEYKQKAEAAVAMMDLAQCSFSYRGQVIAEWLWCNIYISGRQSSIFRGGTFGSEPFIL